ncbi:MAG: hypothetical protein A3H95_07110 [Acidobacteria bacterium RIFCSPLOWO2_02_FULL_64_15]|nr:MAG: hypothetical protein A3H95_07110 [Acidobacteria bacterium RIFCSPLOWO2_02_FULL_64_15]
MLPRKHEDTKKGTVHSSSCFRVFVTVAALVAGVGVRAQAAQVSVTPIARDGQVLVSFDLGVGISDDLRDAIQSGLATTFSCEVALRRATATWFDRTIASVTVTASVRFDNLTRQYQLSRTFDGKEGAAHSTDDEEAVRRWLTEFERVPLSMTSVLEANGEYYVRVRARTRPRNAWILWPWDRSAILGRATFTFVQ